MNILYYEKLYTVCLLCSLRLNQFHIASQQHISNDIVTQDINIVFLEHCSLFVSAYTCKNGFIPSKLPTYLWSSCTGPQFSLTRINTGASIFALTTIALHEHAVVSPNWSTYPYHNQLPFHLVYVVQLAWDVKTNHDCVTPITLGTCIMHCLISKPAIQICLYLPPSICSFLWREDIVILISSSKDF